LLIQQGSNLATLSVLKKLRRFPPREHKIRNTKSQP
jgi:hypothetical protein